MNGERNKENKPRRTDMAGVVVDSVAVRTMDMGKVG